MPATETGDEDKSPPLRRPHIPVVGIGTSAGGVGALQTLIPKIPADCGLAFVVVQHLDPEHKSILPQLLGRVSALPVVQIQDGTQIEANSIYIIPPNVTLTLSGDKLQVNPPVERRGQRTPIDSFFVSLAEAADEFAACVILSGTGRTARSACTRSRSMAASSSPR